MFYGSILFKDIKYFILYSTYVHVYLMQQRDDIFYQLTYFSI